MTAHLQGDQLRYLRWELIRLPAITLSDKLREAAGRYDPDDPMRGELLGATVDVIQKWDRGESPIPPRVMSVVLKILGFPRQFLAEGFIQFCRAKALPRLSVLHLGRVAIKRGAFRGEADQHAWPAIARAVLGPGFETSIQRRLIGEYQCQACGHLDMETMYLICPECGSAG